LVPLSVIHRLIQVQQGRSESDFLSKGYFPIAVSVYRIGGRLLQYHFDINSGKVFKPRRDVKRDEFDGAFIIAKSLCGLLQIAIDLSKFFIYNLETSNFEIIQAGH